MMSQPHRRSSGGQISCGLIHNELLERTLDLVYKSLPAWRDDPERQPANNEEELNSQFCAFLNTVDHALLQMVHFSHEEPQGARRRVDLAAKPINENIIIGSQYTKYTPYLVMEGKCLPPPTNRKQREKEYVTSESDKKIGGGIQRFKLGKHGGKLEVAVIIGYIHENDCTYWLKQINDWISELSGQRQTHGEIWAKKDQLQNFIPDTKVKTSRAESTHSRSDACTNSIILKHFWVETPIAE